jgi:uncharacterized membrane protein
MPGDRVYLFDEIRGIMIINVIIYHFIYDLINFYGMNFSWFVGLPGQLWQEIICGTFILISGACSYYSHNNIWRGLRLLGFAYLITLVTYYMMPDYMISFGILHMLGVSMIVFGLVKDLLSRFPNMVGFTLFAVLYLLTFRVSQGYFGLPFLETELPGSLYERGMGMIFGFPADNYVSADYFPLFPYIFLFFSGSFMGKWVHEGSGPEVFYRSHSRLWAWLGSKSLWLYLIHQPILMAVLWLMFR